MLGWNFIRIGDYFSKQIIILYRWKAVNNLVKGTNMSRFCPLSEEANLKKELCTQDTSCPYEELLAIITDP